MQKTQASNTTQNSFTKKKNSRLFYYILVVVFILALGFILGWYVDFSEKKARIVRQYKKTLIEKSEEQKLMAPLKDTMIMPFINPIAFLYPQTNLCFDELENFKPKVQNYIAKAITDKSIDIVSVYFRDLTNGFWFGINEREKFSPASLNKVPVLIAVLKKAETNPSLLKEKIQYLGSETENRLKQKPWVSMPRTKLKLLKYYTVEELLDYMIIHSDNDATLLLLDRITDEYMRLVKKDLGFIDATDLASESNYISVKAYSTFLRVLYNASYLNKKYSNLALEILSESDYPFGIRAAIPDEIQISHKYGERDHITEADEVQIRQLHHVAIVYYAGKPFLLNIMTKGSNREKLQKVIKDIAEIVYQEVDTQVKQMPTCALERDKEKE